jgi:catechol 2,3-dioxygenase-like lactoylglutathione lyase family enzyme
MGWEVESIETTRIVTRSGIWGFGRDATRIEVWLFSGDHGTTATIDGRVYGRGARSRRHLADVLSPAPHRLRGGGMVPPRMSAKRAPAARGRAGCLALRLGPRIRQNDGPLEGARMLGEHPIDVVLLATDLESSKEFYAGKLGLEILRESEQEVVYKCGGDSQLAVTKSTTGTADEQTQAGWRVDDLVAELADLRARGVEIQEYDTPELKTDNGIVDLGFALIAWIVDPHKNALAIIQLK